MNFIFLKFKLVIRMHSNTGNLTLGRVISVVMQGTLISRNKVPRLIFSALNMLFYIMPITYDITRSQEHKCTLYDYAHAIDLEAPFER